jgi:hypothetical protein
LTRQHCKAPLLRSQRGKDLFHARAILSCLFHLSFSTRAAALMTCRPSELFNECPTLFGAEAQCLVNGALPNEEKTVLCKARAIKELIKVTKPDALSVQQVLLSSASVRATRNLNLREGEIKEAIVVGDAERYLCKSELTALLGAGKDDFVHTLGTDPATRFAERPAKCINDVRLAAPVRADDRGDAWGEGDRGLVGERLEPAEANLAKA